MGTVTFNTMLNEDGQTVRISVMHDGESMVWADMPAENLSGLIEQLVAMRAGMAEEVPMSIAPGSFTAAIPDPRWQMPPAHPEGSRALALRHPGLGWLSFAFPLREAKSIAEAFLADHPIQRSRPLN